MSKRVLKKLVTTFMFLAVIFIVAGLVMPDTASAAKIKKKGDYRYFKCNGGVSIDKYTGKAENVKIPKKIAGKKVVAIDSGAFKNNTKIKSVKIPDTVKYIKKEAFYKCKNLEKVTLPKKLKWIGDKTFCKSGIVLIKIPNNVNEIKEEAFAECKKLKKVTLSKKLRYIPYSCFYNCVKLEKINFDNVEKIGVAAFADNNSIKGKLALKNVVEIENGAFNGCSGITEVEFSDKLQRLGDSENPFAFCKNIEKFVVADNNTFYKCVDGIIYGKSGQVLVACPAKRGGIVNIGSDVIGISEYAFSSAQMSEVNMSTGVNHIGKGVFAEAEITVVNMGKGVNRIDEQAFEKAEIVEVNMPMPDESMVVEWSYKAFEDCKSLKKVVFPEGIKSSYGISFVNCASLTEVVLPESMTELSKNMFYGCEKLESVNLPCAVKSLPASCFHGCKSLKKVNLENIDYIDAFAFYDCDSIADLVNLYVTKIEYAAFYDCDNITEVIFNKGTVEINYDDDYVVLPEKVYNYNSWRIDEYQSEKFFGYEGDGYIGGGNPFAGCKNLKEITTREEGYFKSEDGILFANDMKELVAYPTSRTGKYTIREGVTKVWPGAFEQSALTEVTCSDTVNVLCSYAFCDSKIKKVTVSKSVEAMGEKTFEGSKKLEKINVDTSNPIYESIDGVVYSKNDADKSLIIYPAGKKSTSFKVPDNRKIGENAFNGCVYLKKLYITDMSEDMGYDEFDVFMINCKDVKVYIPANFKMNKYGGCRKDAGGKFAMGYDERCTGCKTYVKKNSKLAKKLDKNGDKYNVY